MKASFTAVSASAVVVLVSTWAQTRTLHSDTLARYEAITSYCEQADPGIGSAILSETGRPDPRPFQQRNCG